MNTETEQVPGQETLPGLDVIEGIDMDLEVQCEDPNEDHAHSHPADVRVLRSCPTCGGRGQRFFCARSWAEYGERFVCCLYCRNYWAREQIFTFLGGLR